MPEESTTPDLVELTRRSFEPLARREVDGIVGFYASDAVWDLSTGGLGVFRGHAAIRGFMEDWLHSYEGVEVDLEEVADRGRGVVFVLCSQKGRLAGSVGEVTIRYGAVLVWVDGLIASATNYSDIDEARAAAERLAEERG